VLSQAVLLANWIAGPAGLGCFGPPFAFWVRKEEQMMLEAFGEAYADYAARTNRIIPGAHKRRGSAHPRQPRGGQRG
jgi:protein-S-isoprenylcysteine O-methyltransferase Ste14